MLEIGASNIPIILICTGVSIFQADWHKLPLVLNEGVFAWLAGHASSFKIDAAFVGFAMRASENKPIPFAVAFASVRFYVGLRWIKLNLHGYLIFIKNVKQMTSR